jgi:hypothetical protein
LTLLPPHLKPNQIAITLERMLDAAFGVYRHRASATRHPDLANLAEKLGIEIVSDIESHEHSPAFFPASECQNRIAAELLDAEFSVYPPEIIRSSRIERIVVCTSLRASGTELAGLAVMGPFVIDTLFIDMQRVTRNWSFARSAVHHEFYHAVDYVDDLDHYIDTEWFHLNVPGFKYSRQHCTGGVKATRRSGFLTNYSMVAVHEDKAELYCHLLTAYDLVMKRCATDKWLLMKVNRMKRLLKDFCPAYDEDFWTRCSERSRLRMAVKHNDWRRMLNLEQTLQHRARR